ncbi:putative phage baseplate assembly protein [Nitrosospira sp. Nsp5]|uniref:Baseplate assembly protein n=1 Tax=Nitrosospira multiformis TaxID=1231 RepID=A0ABY0TCT7_9PROT|nr:MULTISPECIES: putative baseplate assembly protein [Nitrosospira]PTR05772.1 putative phage baseplate assembly protein [Nitrosospira sp. Nsp5]SDQ62579.1 putative baseplate assembly protein [Nitrosospira multiformis]
MNDKSEDCDCCAGTDAETPKRLYNRPGLSEIAYRTGTHHEFKESMLARLSSADLPALAQLTARDDADFGIALCDAAATMLDVLSFYQERIANENFLRTAGERRSILELARLIGYELAPGVAASTHLAFTLQDAPGLPRGVAETVTIPIGSRVQSVPGPDEQPQSFETVEAIQARPEWNVFKAKMREMKALGLGTEVIYLHGIATQLKAGDALLFVSSERENDTGSENWNFRRIQRVVLDSIANCTVVALERELDMNPSGTSASKPKVYALRLRASLFGHNAPDWRVMGEGVKRGYLGLGPTSDITDMQWPGFTIADISDPPSGTATGTGLYGEYFDTQNLTKRKLVRLDATVNFDWGEGSPDSVIASNTFSARWTGWVHAPSTGMYTFYTYSDDGVRLWVNGQLLIDDWNVRAPIERSGQIRLTAEKKYDVKLEFFENQGGAVMKLSWRPPRPLSKEVIPQNRLYPRNIHTLHLDSIYTQILPNSWLLLSTPEDQELYRIETIAEDSRAAFTLTGKTTRLVLQGENLRELFNERLRETAVFAHSDELILAEFPIITDISGNSLHTDRMVKDLMPGRILILSGTTTAGVEASEVLTLLKAELDSGTSNLFFTTSLQNNYKRATIKLYANVASATHGEIVSEPVGSGNAARANQSFTLRQSPLTHVSAATASGRASTLELRVNDLLWREVPSLFGRAAADSVYALTTDDAGRTSVAFGDGIEGARLPSGQDNIRARYRKGIGVAGNVSAGKLSNLLSRPYSVNEVINPLTASGGQDAESGDAARANAPRTVLTLDRAVSIQDYEDFARSFAGIAKAHATWIAAGPGRGVFITVSGEQGASVLEDSRTFRNLLAALRQYGDVLLPLRLSSYRPAAFRLRAAVKVAADAQVDLVLTQVKTALQTEFGFDKRCFGQMVSIDEVMAVLHGVAGLEAVNVLRLYRFDEGAMPRLEPRLFARLPEASLISLPRPAELLLLDAGSLIVEQMP